MPDNRSKRAKLEAMANQSVSPNEAKVARNKLKKLPKEKPITTTYVASGVPMKGINIIWDFSAPFAEDQGEGVYIFNFTTNKWEKH